MSCCSCQRSEKAPLHVTNPRPVASSDSTLNDSPPVYTSQRDGEPLIDVARDPIPSVHTRCNSDNDADSESAGTPRSAPPSQPRSVARLPDTASHPLTPSSTHVTIGIPDVVPMAEAARSDTDNGEVDSLMSLPVLPRSRRASWQYYNTPSTVDQASCASSTGHSMQGPPSSLMEVLQSVAQPPATWHAPRQAAKRHPSTNNTQDLRHIPLYGAEHSMSTPTFHPMTSSNPRLIQPIPSPIVLLPPPPIVRERVTNYVALYRKNSVQKPSLFKQKIVPSSISGDFNIDPSLNVPSSLLKATMDSGQSLTQTQRKNLLLEVENGGIDVNINLIPSATNNNPKRFSTQGPTTFLQRTFSTTSIAPTPAPVSEGHPPTPNADSTQAGHDTTQSLSRSTSRPTLIDLKLKEPTEPRKIKSIKDFPLVARIHAPKPRPHFHLSASTVHPSLCPSLNMTHETNHPADKSSSSESPTVTATTKSPVDTRGGRKSVEPSRLSKSNISLHVPRTFHGPLTIHVAVGDIDQHLHLSTEMQSAVVPLSEDSFSRTYFIGDLEDVVDAGFVIINAQDVRPLEEAPRLPSSPPVPPTPAEPAAENTHSEGIATSQATTQLIPNDALKNDNVEEDGTWQGDKIDIAVSRGHIYLQFLEEQVPFRKKVPYFRNFEFGSGWTHRV